MVIGLVFILAGVIIGASQQREPQLNKLDLQAQKMGSLSATAGLAMCYFKALFKILTSRTPAFSS